MKQDQQVLTLLALEQGAVWPAWSAELRSRAHNVLVEAQLDGESIEAFGARLLARIEKWKERGDRVLGAGYMCGLGGPDHDPVRERVGRALVQLLESSQDAELVLGGGDWVGNVDLLSARARLLTLWGRLSEASPRHPVSIRFEEAAGESGVFERAAGARGAERQKSA